MMKKLVVGILAHVDAGKTTLSEAMLYLGGSIRKLGRVDKGDTFLDTFELEKKRGITIFSKQAVLPFQQMEMTLLDTPGHVDFSAEMERTLQVLDYAVLVISGTEGVQGHTRTLWRLLARHQIPVFLFINKMDLAGDRKTFLLTELKELLGGNFIDFGKAGTSEFYENIAVCGDEAILDRYLGGEKIEDSLIKTLIGNRNVFPCFFGSALKAEGVLTFLQGMEAFMEQPEYGDEFGASVFKVTRDHQGNRMSHMKITGGSLKVREMIDGEKVNQLRVYCGEKFETVNEAQCGTVCAVLGLEKTYPGQGLGSENDSLPPVLEPVLTCRVELPCEVDAAFMLPKLIQLEEESPELHITWEESRKEIHAQIMGEIQTEVLKSMIKERFGITVSFGERSIVYRETIRNTVEGVGHFEPLRHYAEVHLLLEPGEPGSGLMFDSSCSEDILERNWQRLILTHLEEREHKGVLTGAAITDMRISLMSGRAHKKHTEGGDFRQAVYRAVRQGLMKAESVLLEPFYEFSLELPEKLVGRAMNDIERMNGSFLTPLIENERAVLRGSGPVSSMDGYQREVAAYTGGNGLLTCTFKGYGPCHNTDEVIEEFAYDPKADLNHTPDSVFCAHGAGFVVDWDEVEKYMHLESCLMPEHKGRDEIEAVNSKKRETGKGQEREEAWIGTEEIDAILKRTFYANRNDKEQYGKKQYGKKRWGGNKNGTGPAYSNNNNPSGKMWGRINAPQVRTFNSDTERVNYLLVDGYNIIFAWQELKELAAVNIDSARGQLLDILCNYQGIKKCNLIVVFDAYKVQGHATEFLDYHNIHVVFTKEAETADQYIERFAHDNGKTYQVTVATSDYLEQIIIRGQGCLLLSARELKLEIEQAKQMILENYAAKKASEPKGKNYLLDAVSDGSREVIKTLRKQQDGENAGS